MRARFGALVTPIEIAFLQDFFGFFLYRIA
jgi:hypothetical protein